MTRKDKDPNRFYVYGDWTTEPIPRCFYVGKGDGNRVRLLKRNKKHELVAKKHGCQRILIAAHVTSEAANNLEIQFITGYMTFQPRDPHGIGCNFTRGGDGANGFQHNERSILGCQRGGQTRAKSGQLPLIGRMGASAGGKIGGRIAVASGQLRSVSSQAGKIGGKRGGRKAAESGQLMQARNEAHTPLAHAKRRRTATKTKFMEAQFDLEVLEDLRDFLRGTDPGTAILHT